MGNVQIALDLIDGVEDIVAEFGKSVVLRNETKGDYIDPARPSLGRITTTTDTPLDAVIVAFRERDVDGTIVQSGDRRAICDLKGTGVVPDTSYLFMDGTDVWSTINVRIIEVAGVVVTAILQIRR